MHICMTSEVRIFIKSKSIRSYKSIEMYTNIRKILDNKYVWIWQRSETPLKNPCSINWWCISDNVISQCVWDMKSINDEAEFEKYNDDNERDRWTDASSSVALLSRRRRVLWSKRKLCGFWLVASSFPFADRSPWSLQTVWFRHGAVCHLSIG